MIPRRSGRPGAEIAYRAYGQDRVIIDGAGLQVENYGGLVQVQDLEFIRLDGLEVINAGPWLNVAGILVEGCRGIVVRGCRTYNTVSSGIGVWDSQDVLIAENEVELACNDGEQECLTVAGTGGFEVRGNRVHHGGPGSHGAEGITVKDGAHGGSVHHNVVHDNNRLGIYVDAWDKHTRDIEVYANRVYHNRDAGIVMASEMGGLLENVRIFNNLVYDNEFVGISVDDCCSETHPMAGIRIVNNTVVANGWGQWGGGILQANPQAGGVLVRNNIVAGNLEFQIALEGPDPGTVTIDHNLIDGFRGYEGEQYGAEHQEGDPRFRDPQAGDFDLLAGSPAIDHGSAEEAPVVDFAGRSRPQGAGFDIGAYEYPAETTPTPTPTGTPTPEVPGLGVRLELPELIHPGETFQVMGYLENPGPPLAEAALFFVLEVHGAYWFWPGWERYDPPGGGELDYEVRDVPTGVTSVEVAPAFVWPQTTGSDQGLWFHGAMLDATLSRVLGSMASEQWGYAGGA